MDIQTELLERICVALEGIRGEMVAKRAARVFNEVKEAPSIPGPQCPMCGAAMKPSSTGKKWLCTKSAWRRVNGQFVNNGCNGTLDRGQQ
ncbi:MAG: hypothetical protein EHM49_01050 [Deltaproteobacteria bacterium]|nr:MAG: hypothetical protein EHM49_01050 [Deltaproteobacteria bacterium]